MAPRSLHPCTTSLVRLKIFVLNNLVHALAYNIHFLHKRERVLLSTLPYKVLKCKTRVTCVARWLVQNRKILMILSSHVWIPLWGEGVLRIRSYNLSSHVATGMACKRLFSLLLKSHKCYTKHIKSKSSDHSTVMDSWKSAKAIIHTKKNLLHFYHMIFNTHRSFFLI
jgi:hypothetical protein